MRARNIKPSLFKNELLGTADPLLMILFEGLWCVADREGRLEDRPLRLKAEILPYRDGIDMEALLNWLSENKFIARYNSGSIKVIQVLGFADHQHPHRNEVESALPALDSKKNNQGPKSARPRKASLRLIPDSLILDTDPLIPETPSAGFSVPEGLNLEAWREWQAYRKLKPASLQAAARKLAKLGDRQAEAVEHSIACGYTGLYPPHSDAERSEKPKPKITWRPPPDEPETRQ